MHDGCRSGKQRLRCACEESLLIICLTRQAGGGGGAVACIAHCDLAGSLTVHFVRGEECLWSHAHSPPSLLHSSTVHRTPIPGIFIHWGLYAVPGWAVKNHTHNGEEVDSVTTFTHMPFAEWYYNTMRLEGSPTKDYHAKMYDNMPYLGFVPMFNDQMRSWDPDAWATLFRYAGAKYVVLTTKHHDGFTLWPSEVPNPHRYAPVGCPMARLRLAASGMNPPPKQ